MYATPCRVTADLRAHLSGDARRSRREEAIERQVETLTEKGEDYYPFSPKNFYEAWGELPMVDMARIQANLDAGNAATAGGALLYAIKNHWLRAARARAEEIVTCACPECFGTGCARCEDQNPWKEG